MDVGDERELSSAGFDLGAPGDGLARLERVEQAGRDVRPEPAHEGLDVRGDRAHSAPPPRPTGRGEKARPARGRV